MFDLLKGLNENRTTVVYVTHDQTLAALASRIASVRDGLIVGDTGRSTMSTLSRKAWVTSPGTARARCWRCAR